MKITELFNVSCPSQITEKMFLDLKKNGCMPDETLETFYNIRDPNASESYKNMTVAEHIAHTIAEQRSQEEGRRRVLLGSDRATFYNAILNRLVHDDKEKTGDQPPQTRQPQLALTGD